MSQMKSEDWFVTIDLKGAHVFTLPHHRKFLRFAFGGKSLPTQSSSSCSCTLTPHFHSVWILFWLLHDPRASAYIDWLMLAQLELEAIRHRDVVLAHMKELGVKTKRQEMCAFSITEDHLSRWGLGFDHDAGTVFPCSVRVETPDSQQGERRPVTHYQAVSRLSLMAAASNVVTFGLLYVRPLQWWLKTKRFSPRGNPLRMLKVTRRCLRVLDMRMALLDGISLMALLPGDLQRVHRMGKRALFWRAEYARTWFSLLGGSLEKISIWRDLLSQAEGMICPARSGGSYGHDHRGGTSRSFWSQPRLLRPSSKPELPLQGNCTPRSGSFHFLVWRLPARPSQLPSWYSSGVPAGPFLLKVDPLHPRGLRGGHCGLTLQK